MRRISLAIALIISLVTASIPAQSQDKLTGHIMPLDSELLSPSIHLACGLTIKEWRGGPRDRARVESLCMLAIKSLDPYLKENHLEKIHNRPFDWSASLLPWGKCYRCINDLDWRFRYRQARFLVTGYTSLSYQYTFTVGNIEHRNFDVSFLHEMWHAMSYYYGIYDNHPGDEAAKLIADEHLAVGFTQWLGFGK